MKKILILVSLISVYFCQEIIDFTHSDSIQRTTTALEQKYDFHIDAQPKKHDYLAFPESCSLSDGLENT